MMKLYKLGYFNFHIISASVTVYLSEVYNILKDYKVYPCSQ